jgi:hypothetical protein
MATLKNITNCRMSRSPEVHAFGSTGAGPGAGDGAKARVVGTDDWTATLEQNAHGKPPEILPGATGTFTITAGIAPNANLFSAAAVCLDVSTDYDVDTGAPMKRTYEIAGNGAVTTDQTGGTGAAAFSSKNAVFTWT